MKLSGLRNLSYAVMLAASVSALSACDQPNRAVQGQTASELRELSQSGQDLRAYELAIQKSGLGHPFAATYIRRAIESGIVPPERYPEAVEGLSNVARTTPTIYLWIAGMAQRDPAFEAAAGSPTEWYARAHEAGVETAALDAAVYEIGQGNEEAARDWARRGLALLGDRPYSGDPAVVNRVLNLQRLGVADLALEDQVQLTASPGTEAGDDALARRVAEEWGVEAEDLILPEAAFGQSRPSAPPAANAPVVEGLARRMSDERGVEEAAPYLEQAFDAYEIMKAGGDSGAAFAQARLVEDFPDQFADRSASYLDLLLEARALGHEAASLRIAREMEEQGLEVVGDDLPLEVFWREGAAMLAATVANGDAAWQPFALLANIYWVGKGGEVNRQLALGYLERAIERGGPSSLQTRLDNWRRTLGGPEVSASVVASEGDDPVQRLLNTWR